MTAPTRSPRGCHRWPCLLGVALVALGCNDARYELRVAFDPPELADSATRVELALVPRCGDQRLGEAAVGAVATAASQRDGETMSFGGVDPGSYGLYGRAFDDACGLVAAGCMPVSVQAGGQGTLSVVLDRMSGPACPPDRCVEGMCTPGADGGPLVDAGLDAAPVDGGCASDCDDGDPCTDDRCVMAACRHTTRDADDDGHGDATCPEAGGVPNDDCDDASAAVAPGQEEVCNGGDDDCDERTDEGFECVRGETEACGSCGPGSRVCLDSCSFGPCLPEADDDTVALWAFEEEGPAFDDVTGAHDGAMVSGTSARVDGPRFCGQAMELDGSGFGEVANSSDFDLDVGSVSMWVRFDADGIRQGVLSRDELNVDTRGHLNLRRLPTGEFQARIQAVGTTHACTTAEAVALDAWHEVVVRFGPPGFELVVDGIPTTCTGAAAWLTGIAGNANPFTFGANQQETPPGESTGADDLLDGAIDRVELRSGRAPADAPVITRFVLVDADTERDIGPLYDGVVLELASLPDNLNFRVTADPGAPGSVRITLDGERRTPQDAAPFSLADNGGDYSPIALTPGEHELTATAFPMAMEMGTPGPTATLRFTVR